MDELNNEEFIRKLEELKGKDMDAFMEIVFYALSEHQDFAVEDDVPIENKMEAMTKVMKHFERKEEFEKCAFLRDLKQRIEDGTKG